MRRAKGYQAMPDNVSTATFKLWLADPDHGDSRRLETSSIQLTPGVEVRRIRIDRWRHRLCRERRRTLGVGVGNLPASPVQLRRSGRFGCSPTTSLSGAGEGGAAPICLPGSAATAALPSVNFPQSPLSDP